MNQKQMAQKKLRLLGPKRKTREAVRILGAKWMSSVRREMTWVGKKRGPKAK